MIVIGKRMNIEQQAKQLANLHISDADTIEVLWSDTSDNEVRLVEISTDVITTGDVLPFRFAPTNEFQYHTVIVVLSPDEKEMLFEGKTSLPEYWQTKPNALKTLATKEKT